MRSPILIALFHPLNILTSGVIIFAGLISAWWLAPVGVVVWGIMVFNVARDQALHFNYKMQQREPLAKRFQPYFERIERAQIRIFNTLAAAPAKTRKALQPVREAVDALSQQVYLLCQKMTALENYRVVSQSQMNLSNDLKHINEAIEKTDDELVRREYEESRQAIQERLEKLQAAATQLDRVEGQLLALANDMDGVVTEVMRLQAAGPGSAADYVPDLVERIQKGTERLASFEKDAMRL
ncbi:MAG: hypothetical protein JXA21_08835 [Anaerolineae bacterium]|nr:hypothetical protein [Anaerolineae bacterium]